MIMDYGDYTSLSTNLNPGQSKNIKLKPGFSGDSYLEYWRVWVDWNEDGDFDDSGELEVETSSTGNITEQITVPAAASSGDKIMRVSMKYGGYPDPCEIFTYGEVEDYTIFVTGSNPLIAQNDTPEAIHLDNKAIDKASDVIEVRDFNHEFDVKLYPNPTTNFINIEVKPSNDPDTKLVMYNELGQLVYQFVIESGNHTIDVSGSKFANGLYMIKLQNGDQIISKRVIITK